MCFANKIGKSVLGKGYVTYWNEKCYMKFILCKNGIRKVLQQVYLSQISITFPTSLLREINMSGYVSHFDSKKWKILCW